MAYFSNGSEGREYQARYCDRCHHDRNSDCYIWALHLIHLGEDDMAYVLDALIPRSADGIGNEECRAFRPTPEAD